MAIESDFLRFLAGAGMGFGQSYSQSLLDKYQRDDRAKKVEEQRRRDNLAAMQRSLLTQGRYDARQEQRRQWQIDDDEAAANAPAFKGGWFGMVPSMTQGEYDNMLRGTHAATQWQHAFGTDPEPPADPLATLRARVEEAELGARLRKANAPPVGGAPPKLQRGQASDINRLQFGEVSTRNGTDYLDPGEDFTEREFVAFPGISPEKLEAESSRMESLGLLDPREPDAGEKVLRSMMLPAEERPAYYRSLVAIRKMDALIAEHGKIPDYNTAVNDLMSDVGMSREEATLFIQSYQPSAKADAATEAALEAMGN